MLFLAVLTKGDGTTSIVDVPPGGITAAGTAGSETNPSVVVDVGGPPKAKAGMDVKCAASLERTALLKKLAASLAPALILKAFGEAVVAEPERYDAAGMTNDVVWQAAFTARHMAKEWKEIRAAGGRE